MTSIEHGNHLLAAVRGTIEEYRMIPPHAAVIAAVSGGPDSVALLHVLHILSQPDRFRITVAHLNHLLRADSGRDAAFVQAMASEIGVECRVKEIDVTAAATLQGISIEEAGRRARYTFFESVRESEGADLIATAHHLDDELETFFLRLFRGSSLHGLLGIPPVRDRVIRPLIRARKAEILRFLEERKVPYKMDRTNLQADTDRNFIRNRLFPLIEARFEGFRKPLGRTMELVRAEDRLLEQLTSKLYAETISQTGNTLAATLPGLLSAPDELTSRVILSALYNISGANARWGRSHVRLALKVLRSRNPSAKADLGSGVSVHRGYDRLFFTRKQEEVVVGPAFIMVSGPGRVIVPGSETILDFTVLSGASDIRWSTCAADRAYFDADQVRFPLAIRFPRHGDKFRPWGLEGSRKLKKALIDVKVPRKLRSRMPLVVKGEDILWIPGIRRGQAAPVGPETSSVLEIRLVRGDSGP